MLGFIVIIIIFVLSFFTDRIMEQKLNTPKRFPYKHERKSFLVLFILICVVFAASVLAFRDTNFFFIFPFVGTIVFLLFAFEKFLYKKDTRLYVHYLASSAYWFIAGITAFLLF